MGKTIPITCIQCGQVSMKLARNANKAKYCSLKCSGLASWDGKRPDPIERFKSKILKGGPDDCWPYIAGKVFFGYGSFRYKGKSLLAHRLAYELENGPIQKTKENPKPVVRHTCDNPPCCNPKHLVLGTAGDNVKDSWDRGRRPTRVYTPKKLTPDVIQTIAESRLPMKELAASLGISISSISKVRQKLKSHQSPHSGDSV